MSASGTLVTYTFPLKENSMEKQTDTTQSPPSMLTGVEGTTKNERRLRMNLKPKYASERAKGVSPPATLLAKIATILLAMALPITAMAQTVDSTMSGTGPLLSGYDMGVWLSGDGGFYAPLNQISSYDLSGLTIDIPSTVVPWSKMVAAVITDDGAMGKTFTLSNINLAGATSNINAELTGFVYRNEGEFNGTIIGGDITVATTPSSGSSAYGAYFRDTTNPGGSLWARITNSVKFGTITVSGDGTAANGNVGFVAGVIDGSVKIDAINATATNSFALGAQVDGVNGSLEIGNMVIDAENTAIGLRADGPLEGTTTLGAITATSNTGSAYGVDATVKGGFDVNLILNGNILVTGDADSAGIKANNVTLTLGAGDVDITAESAAGAKDRTGILAAGDLDIIAAPDKTLTTNSVNVGGNLDVSGGGFAQLGEMVIAAYKEINVGNDTTLRADSINVTGGDLTINLFNGATMSNTLTVDGTVMFNVEDGTIYTSGGTTADDITITGAYPISGSSPPIAPGTGGFTADLDFGQLTLTNNFTVDAGVIENLTVTIGDDTSGHDSTIGGVLSNTTSGSGQVATINLVGKVGIEDVVNEGTLNVWGNTTIAGDFDDNGVGVTNVAMGATLSFDSAAKINNLAGAGTVTSAADITINGTAGTFSGIVDSGNDAVINGGRFGNGFEVAAGNDVIINGGRFYGDVELDATNDAVINGGRFDGEVTFVNDAFINGGRFDGIVDVTHDAFISGGLFNGNVAIGNDADISGGRFNGTVTAINDVNISGGTFNDTVQSGGDTNIVVPDGGTVTATDFVVVGDLNISGNGEVVGTAPGGIAVVIDGSLSVGTQGGDETVVYLDLIKSTIDGEDGILYDGATLVASADGIPDQPVFKFGEIQEGFNILDNSIFGQWAINRTEGEISVSHEARKQARISDGYLAAMTMHNRFATRDAVRDRMISGNNGGYTNAGYGYYGQVCDPCDMIDTCESFVSTKTRNLWANYIGRSDSYRSVLNDRDWKLSSDGVQVGSDFYNSLRSQFGMLFGYEAGNTYNDRVNFQGATHRDRVTADDFYFGFYGSRVFNNGADVHATVAYGQQKYKMNRYGTASSDLYKSAFRGNTWESNIDFGKRYSAGTWSLRPSVGVDFFSNHLNNTTEVGDDAERVRYNGSNLTQTFIRMGTDFRYQARRFTLNSGVYYAYDLCGQNLRTSVTHDYSGLTPGLVGTALGRSLLTMNVGGDYKLSKNVSLFGGYESQYTLDGASKSMMNVGYIGTGVKW